MHFEGDKVGLGSQGISFDNNIVDGSVDAFSFELTDGDIQFPVAGTLESVMGQNFTESSLSSLASGESNNVKTTVVIQPSVFE